MTEPDTSGNERWTKLVERHRDFQNSPRFSAVLEILKQRYPEDYEFRHMVISSDVEVNLFRSKPQLAAFFYDAESF